MAQVLAVHLERFAWGLWGQYRER